MDSGGFRGRGMELWVEVGWGGFEVRVELGEDLGVDVEVEVGFGVRVELEVGVE